MFVIRVVNELIIVRQAQKESYNMSFEVESVCAEKSPDKSPLQEQVC